MKRVMFIVGAGIGFVLGARAGRERYEQIKSAAITFVESDSVRKGVELAQRGTDAATDQLARVSGKVSTSSREIPAKFVHTAESLREDLRRRADDALSNIDEARDSAREWMDHAKEITREKQAQGVVAVGDLLSEALVELEDLEDEMVDEGKADERNLKE